MDWIALLMKQQNDFIQRLHSNCYLHCEIEGRNSELTIISGERLRIIRKFCWDMVKKYKSDDPENAFKNNLKGKLGEEVIKSRLSNFVSKVDYKNYLYGDGGVDFTLASHPDIGFQVKTRQGDVNKIKWKISKKEIDKNVVLVCVLIQEEVDEAQNEYNLILAGFLPTKLININNNISVELGVNELFYCGGLRSYLESLTTQPLVLQNKVTEHDLEQLSNPQNEINNYELKESEATQDKLAKYNSSLEELMSYIIDKIIHHKDFIGQFESTAECKVVGRSESFDDNDHRLIEGEITYYTIDDYKFEIADSDISNLEWIIGFEGNGRADIGYVNYDGEYRIQGKILSCDGKVNLNLPDYFREEFLTGDTIEKIIEDVIAKLTLEVYVYTVYEPEDLIEDLVEDLIE